MLASTSETKVEVGTDINFTCSSYYSAAMLIINKTITALVIYAVYSITESLL